MELQSQNTAVSELLINKASVTCIIIVYFWYCDSHSLYPVLESQKKEKGTIVRGKLRNMSKTSLNCMNCQLTIQSL